MDPTLAYAALLLAAVGLLTVRSSPVRIRMRTAFALHLLALMAWCAHLVGTEEPRTYLLAALLTVGTVATGLVRAWWYVGPCSVGDTREEVEDCLARLRFEATAEPGGWLVRSGGVETHIALRPLPGPGLALKLPRSRTDPKLGLLRQLLAKRFGPLLPRPSFRLR